MLARFFPPTVKLAAHSRYLRLTDDFLPIKGALYLTGVYSVPVIESR